MYYIIELITRADGIVNNTMTARSTYALGESYYHERAAVGAASDQPATAVMLIDQYGNVLMKRAWRNETTEEEVVEE